MITTRLLFGKKGNRGSIIIINIRELPYYPVSSAFLGNPSPLRERISRCSSLAAAARPEILEESAAAVRQLGLSFRVVKSEPLSLCPRNLIEKSVPPKSPHVTARGWDNSSRVRYIASSCTLAG